MSAKPMRLGEKMRAKLIESEQTLSEALQAARACLFETGPDLRVTEMGGQSGWIHGDAVQLIGKKIDELVADRDDPEVRNTLADIGSHKPFRDLTLQAPSSQGLRFVRASGKPRFGARQFAGYRGIAVDITPAIDSEHRAAADHRALVEAIESIPASLMLFDADDRLAICNSITKRYFPGATHLLVPGTRFEDLLRADIASGFLWRSGLDIEKWIARRMKRHRSAKTSLTGQRSDGRWIQVTERRTSDGGTIGIRTDVTKLKRAEMQLTQAKELAEAASHAKSAFLAHMSHDCGRRLMP